MTRIDWLEELSARGALLSGHFLLSSGRHSNAYVQCARALEDPALAEQMGHALSDAVHVEFDRVIAPPLGGLLIGHEVARAAGTNFLFPERDAHGALCLRRGFSLVPDEEILIVEDVITTGRTTRELISLVAAAGSRPVGIAAIVDRSVIHAVDGFPIRALAQLVAETHAPDDCPACRRGTPIDRPGSRPPDHAAANGRRKEIA